MIYYDDNRKSFAHRECVEVTYLVTQNCSNHEMQGKTENCKNRNDFTI